MYASPLQEISMIFVRKLVNNMGIKNEEPEDKVIFDSVDAADPCACHDCVYKESTPYKEPCRTCLSPLNDKSFYKEGSVDAEHIKNDIVKTESELDIKLNKIENMLKDISYNLELLGDEIGKIEERLGI